MTWFLLGIMAVLAVPCILIAWAITVAVTQREQPDDFSAARMDSIRAALREDVAGVRLIKRRHVRAGGTE
jgi:hypothetical protein